MGWFVGQSVAVIVLAFVLGVVTGRLLPRAGRRDRSAPREAPVAAAAPAPRDDRLERIEGIGPRMAAALRATGIRSFEQLADATDDAKRAALTGAGLSFAPSLVTWSRQARLLADGDETGFTELTEQLTAGREQEGGTGVAPLNAAVKKKAKDEDKKLKKARKAKPEGTAAVAEPVR